jgi:medium-chain acyl-[acyl-carrier-protein] hydrolase
MSRPGGVSGAVAGGTRWIVRFQPRPRARLRLFCFPYAGAGASAYRAWPAGFPETVEVAAVQLPGREGRFGEPLLTDVQSLAAALPEALVPLLDRPFALFGHSLGAVSAYETARRLRRDHGLSPGLLAVSGHQAPGLPAAQPPIHHLARPAFVEEVRKLNGTPAEVFADQELLALVLPQLMADFRMAETYVPSDAGPLTCPVLALGSTEDPRVSEATLRPWAEVTSGPCRVRMLPGDHSYVQSHRAALLALLGAEMAPLLA